MSDKFMSVSWIPEEGMFRIANPTEMERRLQGFGHFLP